VEFGGGVVSVVLVTACSSSEEAIDGPVGTTAPGDGDAPDTTAPLIDGGDTPGAEEIEWKQVSFGFVSAYLLQRGREVAIVDTGTGTTEEFEAGLAALGASWSSVADVILTHSHGDHIGGLGAVIENAPGAKAYAGAGDLEAIAAGGFDADGLIGLDDGDEVFGLEVIGTPGHTPGHIAVFDSASGLLVAGDAVNTSEGRITGPNPDFTPDMVAANASVARILAGRQINTALVGHGAPLEGNAGASLAALVTSLG
jgi:glyoxylase-like metal-dependent hydrolase (beta-lactamase superfamily II)